MDKRYNTTMQYALTLPRNQFRISSHTKSHYTYFVFYSNPIWKKTDFVSFCLSFFFSFRSNARNLKKKNKIYRDNYAKDTP